MTTKVIITLCYIAGAVLWLFGFVWLVAGTSPTLSGFLLALVIGSVLIAVGELRGTRNSSDSNENCDNTGRP